MCNRIYFLRHALTTVDVDIPSKQWSLSEEGLEDIKILVKQGIFDEIEVIFSSAEKKAIQTAFFVSERIKKPIITKSDFNELERKSTLKNEEEYKQLVKKVFSSPNKQINGWEKASDALLRFENEIQKIKNDETNKTILIVSHGIVLSLYFAKLLKIAKEQIYERWKKLAFCACGIVENQHVIKDIMEKE